MPFSKAWMMLALGAAANAMVPPVAGRRLAARTDVPALFAAYAPFDAQVTASPMAEAKMELARRQVASITALIAPDNTCGYLSGASSSPWACPTNYICSILTTTSSYGRVECCSGTAPCGIKFGCIDSASVSRLCGTSCLSDTQTLKCTSASFSLCATISFAGGAQDFYCDSTSITTFIPALTTITGGGQVRIFTTRVITVNLDDLSSTLSSSSSSSSSRSSSSSASTGPSTTTSPSPGPTSTSAVPDSGGSSGPNIGAIVGGVVGGVAVLALIALGVWFIMRKSRRDNRQVPPANSAMAGHPNQPTTVDPSHTGSPPPAGWAQKEPYHEQNMYATSPVSATHTGYQSHGGQAQAQAPLSVSNTGYGSSYQAVSPHQATSDGGFSRPGVHEADSAQNVARYEAGGDEVGATAQHGHGNHRGAMSELS